MKKKSHTTFIKELKQLYGNKFDYSKVEYKGTKTPVILICEEHGEFKQTPASLLRGINCTKCTKKHKLTTKDYIKKLKKLYGNKYEYNKVVYKGTKHNVILICKKHGEFKKRADVLLKGSGCIKCKNSTEVFINKAKKIHGEKYDYTNAEYCKAKEKIKLTCKKHGEFEQLPNDHLDGHGCQKCVTNNNKSEKDIKKYVRSLGVKYNVNTRKIIPPLELDIYIPKHNLAIEYNGLYWHSEIYKDKNYHLNKTRLCEEKNIKLLHIFEDEWLYRSEVVKSKIKNALGLTSNKLFARKGEIRVIETKEAREFLERTHLQGYTNASIKLGLFFNNKLKSVMLFNKPRLGVGSNKKGYELSRFSSELDTIVVGGAGRLLNYFIKNYKPETIYSYADRRWSGGELYKELGFDLVGTNKPNYWYIVDKNRKHRFNYRKERLKKLGLDIKNKTEHQIMLEQNVFRIYDCGTLCFEKKIRSQ